MSRFSDDDLRAVLRLRAAGEPGTGLRQRIRRATGRPQEPRAVAALPGVARRRTVVLRFTATFGIVAMLILAPLVGALSDVRQRLDLQAGHGARDGLVALATADQGDGDGDDRDDDEDDEDEGDDDDDQEDEDDDQDDEDDEDDEEPEDGD